MAFFFAIFKFLGSNLKWLALLAAISSALYLTTYILGIVRENGELGMVIQTQAETIKSKDDTIKIMEKQRLLDQYVISERDEELGNLEEKLDNLTNNLGEDSKDLAPKAIREYFRRLRETAK